MSLREEVELVLDKCSSKAVRTEYEARLTEGALVRDENETSHFCAYFVPYNPETKEVFIGDHKKSGLWLMPGGHIDAGEGLLQTVNREIEEELGVAEFFAELPEPFILTITNIELNEVRSCRKHFDIWYLVETNGSDFQVDMTEYHEVRWATLTEARKLIVDPPSLQALKVLENL